MERRLTTILAADVVGYSRLMETDEAGTLAALKAHRRALIDPTISEHHGRTVKLMGDGALVEFASVVEAVSCALAIQNGMAVRNREVPEARRIALRIGVHLGDVIVEGEDLYGDGVNVAARLESLAEPGGVCLSQQAYDQVETKIELAVKDLGPQQVKNIARPVRAYLVEPADRSATEARSAVDSALASSKPSIAVLPFTNMSGDPAQEYFSDGITEDIITELSRFRSLLVVARHSSFAFKSRDVDIKTIGRELGVRYVVEGSLRKAGKRIRVTAQLIEAASGNHVWAERYDRELEDIFEIQDDLVRSIVSTVGGRIEAAGKRRAGRAQNSNLPAYDLCLRAQALQDQNTKEAYAEAEGCLRRAIDIDRDMAQACHQLSLVKFWQWFVHWSEAPEADFAEAFRFAKRALELDDSDGLVHAHLCLLHIYRREFDEGGHRIEQALRLNPNDAKVLGIYANYLIAVGDSEKAVELLDELARINPLEPAWIVRLKAIAYLTVGRHQDAVSLLKSLESPTNLARGWLASSLANAGRLDEARETLKEFLRVAEHEMVVFPGRSLAAWRSAWRGIPYKDPATSERFFEGLRKAGLGD
jgi:adenylate cyclase